MNLNIKDFLTPKEARDWAAYFGRECDCKISYDYFYDNAISTKFDTVKEGRRICYSFMNDYKFGLTPHCKKNIASCVAEEHELQFYLKQKGRSFIYVVRYEPVAQSLPVISYKQMELSDYVVM